MKNRRNAVIQLAILVVLGTAVLLTLILPQMPGSRVVKQPLEVSVLLRESDSTVWSNARLGMEQAAGELGAELRFLTLTSDNDNIEQEDLLEREVQGGANVLVVVPADSAGLSEACKQLSVQRPVVTMESQLEKGALTVAPDNEQLGQQLAQAALEDWEQGTVLLLDTAPGSAGVSVRLLAAQQTLEQAGVSVQTCRVSVSNLTGELEGLVKRNNATQIIAFEASATERSAQVKESVGLGQALYGVGVTTNIAAWLERGTVSAVAAWSDYAAGYLAVEGAIKIAQGMDYQAQPLTFYVLRGEDIYEPNNQKLLFPVTS